MKRAWMLGAAALAALLVAVPSTSGAWTAQLQNPATAATVAPYFACSDAYAADRASAYFQWPLTEAAGASSALDVSQKGSPGTYVGPMQVEQTAPIACPVGGGTAYRPNGTSSSVQQSGPAFTAPTRFTVEIWFRTAKPQGVLIGFGDRINASTPQVGSNLRDRGMYIDSGGDVEFGVLNASRVPVFLSTSTGGFADDRWHHAAATFGPSGAALWVDGARVAQNAANSSAAYTGNWRVGYDAVTGFQKPPVSGYFQGSLRWAAAYSAVLPDASIRAHYAAGAPAAAR